MPRHGNSTAICEPATRSAPFKSYAWERSDQPRFNLRDVTGEQRFYPAHCHDYFQIIYYRTDAPALRIGLKSYRPTAGSIYFVPAMASHQIRFNADTRCVVIYFDADFLRPTLTRACPIDQLVRLAPELSPFAWQDHLDFRLSGTMQSSVERAIEVMQSKHLSQQLCATEIVRGALLLMLADLSQAYEPQMKRHAPLLPVRGRDAAHMRRISTFIGEHFTEAPDLNVAAHAVNLSRSRFCALLRQNTGTTYVNLLQKLRMEEACQRLLLTDAAIGRIAGDVGYDDDKYFLRVFKRVLGMTPSDYRKANTQLDRPVPGRRLQAGEHAGAIG